MDRLKVDLHAHTSASFDGWVSPRRFVRRATELGLGAAAVTDHGTIVGALAVRDLAPPFRVIVGQEVLSAVGEIVALFIEEEIPGGLSAEETIDRIHAQGGLAMLAHPFARFAAERIRPKHFRRIVERFDLIETANARNNAADDRKAAEFAARHGKPGAAGSDSHAARDMGRAYQWVRPFDGAADFLAAMGQAEPVVERRTSLGLSGALMMYGVLRRPFL